MVLPEIFGKWPESSYSVVEGQSFRCLTKAVGKTSVKFLLSHDGSKGTLVKNEDW